MPDPVRIAIIDSGAHPDHPHINAAGLLPGVTIAGDGALIDEAEATLDRLGHGTAVTAAIQEKAPAALCIPVRVFRDSLKTTARALVAAIDWCVDERVALINLSLGTVNPAHRPAFEAAAERALAAGVLIVAARAVNGLPCYPGSLPQVLSVGLDWDCPRETFQVSAGEGGPVFHASGHPRPIPGVAQSRNLYGISFAVANMTGLAAQAQAQGDRAATGRGGVTALRALLEARGATIA